MRYRYSFENAFLNKDDSKKYNRNAIEVENCSVFEYGDNGVVNNIKGTSLESATFIDDGWDIVNVFNRGNYLYAFITNETIATGDVNSKLKRIEVNTNTVETILDDTPFPSVGKYSFSRSHPIYSMALVDETYVAWTDNNSQPMIVNIDDGIANPNIEKSDLYIIKEPPEKEPSASIVVGDYVKNDLVDEGYQFCYYYIYKNNFESAISFYSDTVFVNKDSNADSITVGYNTGDTDVEYAVLCFRYLGSKTLYEIDKIDVKGKNSLQQTISFRNDLSYSLVPDNKKNKLFDNVPIKAETISHFNSLIGLQNYYEGYDEELDIDASVAFNAFTEANKIDEQRYDAPTTVGATQTFDVSNLDTGTYSSSYVVKVYMSIGYSGIGAIPPGKFVDFSYTLTSDEASFELFFNNTLKPEILSRTMFRDTDGTLKQMFKSIIHNGVGGIEFDTRDTEPFYYLNNISIELYPYSSFNTFMPKMIQYGIQYYDEYNRSMGYHKIGDGVEIDDVYESQSITISHLAPAHAVKYKIVRAASKDFFRRIAFFRKDAYIISPQESFDGEFYEGDIYHKVMIGIDEEEFVEEGHRVFVYLRTPGENSGKKMLPFVVDGKLTYDDEVDGSGYTGTYLVLETREADYANDVFYAVEYMTAGEATIFHEEIEYTPGSDPLFYELPGTYDISSLQYHQANTQNQTDTLSAILTINDGDIVFSGDKRFKKIKEGVYYDRVGRPSFLLREKKQQHRSASITVSEKYVENTGYNGLNSFDTNQNNYYDYDIDNGAVKFVEPYFEDIVVFQERSVLRHGIRKNILTSQSGEIVVEVGRTFGEKREYLGGFGLSNPMSVKQHNGRIYFADSGNTKRIGRLAGDGIEDISGAEQKMLSYFQRFIPKDIADYQITSAIKPREDKYVINIKDGQNNFVLDYDINRGVWVYSELSEPDFIVSSRADLFSFKDVSGVIGLYKHNHSSNFYGTIFTSRVRFALNELGQGNNVVITNVFLEASKPLKVKITDKAGANSVVVEPTDFEKKEGYYYAPLPKTIMTESISSMAVHAVGSVLAFEEPNIVRINGGINKHGVNVGNSLYKKASPNDVLIGEISGVYNDRVYTVAEITEPLTGGDFLYTKTPEALEGDDLRSDVFVVDVLEEDGDAFTLEAINFEYDVSSV